MKTLIMPVPADLSSASLMEAHKMLVEVEAERGIGVAHRMLITPSQTAVTAMRLIREREIINTPACWHTEISYEMDQREWSLTNGYIRVLSEGVGS